MERGALLTAAAFLLPAIGSAGSLELAGYVGPAFPFYEQSFRYDPGLFALPIPGVTIRQSGEFRLDARGGLAFGGSLTWFLAGSVGVEGRLDTAGVDVRPTAATYSVRADLPTPLPDLSTEIALGSGVADVERLKPISLNVKLRTPGAVKVTVSGGLSYLPSLEASVTQRLGLGVTGIDGGRFEVVLASLAFRAEARPEGEGQGRLGVNVGAGLQLPVLRGLFLVAEARYFLFRKQTLTWSPIEDRPLSRFEEPIVQELLRRLKPVEFNPTFFQATAGVAWTFRGTARR